MPGRLPFIYQRAEKPRDYRDYDYIRQSGDPFKRGRNAGCAARAVVHPHPSYFGRLIARRACDDFDYALIVDMQGWWLCSNGDV